MTIRGAKSIAEFKQMQQAEIERWIDRHFLPSAGITWKMHDANAIELTDIVMDKPPALAVGCMTKIKILR